MIEERMLEKATRGRKQFKMLNEITVKT